jgi:hypothetical protein
MQDASQKLLSVNQSGLTPWKMIQTYSSDEWEEFIEEWSEGFNPPYSQVVRLGGAGDKGRDIIGYIGDPTDNQSELDIYQCKHYDHALRPTDIYVELGKLCVFTYKNEYKIPRRYRFVAPCGVGTKLHDLLKKPDVLRQELINKWDQYCRKEISDFEEIFLDGDLKTYIESFDFKIVWFLTPHEVLNQHQSTKYWHRRFKIDPPERPENESIPCELQPYELIYTKCLLDAYADHLKQPVESVNTLKEMPKLFRHFQRSRGCFFAAEALARFSRDNFEPGAFELIKRHIFDGIIDITEINHSDGYQCVLEVTKAATLMPLPKSDLLPFIGPADKKGVCHHLANDEVIVWCQHE